MATLTIRLADDKHTRLKALAKARGISLNKLIEEFSNIALAEFDAQTRFKALAPVENEADGIIAAKLDP